MLGSYATIPRARADLLPHQIPVRGWGVDYVDSVGQMPGHSVPLRNGEWASGSPSCWHHTQSFPLGSVISLIIFNTIYSNMIIPNVGGQ